jgi:hypothetical protein
MVTRGASAGAEVGGGVGGGHTAAMLPPALMTRSAVPAVPIATTAS